MNKPCKKNDIFFNITSVVADAYAAEIRTFVDCIVEDRSVPVNGADARAATATAIAATRSLDEGCPVTVAETGA